MTSEDKEPVTRINGKPHTTGRKPKTGRPSTYSEEKAIEFCSHLIEGKTLKQVCEMDDMPNVRTVFRWIAEHESFCQAYTRAKAMQAEWLANEIVDLADAPLPAGDNAAVQRAKLQIDVRKWTAMKLLPKKYGDKVEIEHQGEVKTVAELDPAERRQLARVLLTARANAAKEVADHVQDEEDSE